jgi:hypothetical protein
MARNIFKSAALSLFGRGEPKAVAPAPVKELDRGLSVVDLDSLLGSVPNESYKAGVAFALSNGVIPRPVQRLQRTQNGNIGYYEIPIGLQLPYKPGRTQEIVFFGESTDVVTRFSEKLMGMLVRGDEGAGEAVSTCEESLYSMLNELAGTFFPDKEFWSPTEGVYELRSSVREVERREAMVKLAVLTGAPLEFGYDSRRSPEELSTELVTRTHRANVHFVDATGFMARHKRGLRRYNFDKMRWAIAEGYKGRVVEYELRLTIKLEPSPIDGHRAFVELDRLRSRGELNERQALLEKVEALG